MKNRPAIWNKLDKLINEHPYRRRYYVISDKDYKALYDAIPPIYKLELEALGCGISLYNHSDGKEYECLCYKTIPFISETEFKKYL